MPFWGIHDYRPQWSKQAGELREHLRAIRADFTGRPIHAVWTLWDVENDEWFNDAPVIVDVGGSRLEICATKLDEMSVSVNTIDIAKPVFWCSDEDDGEPAMRWTDRIHSCLTGVASQRIESFCIMEYRIDSGLQDMLGLNWVVAGIGLELEDGYFEVSNGLDCNAMTRSRASGEDNCYFEVRD